jgi:DNA-binding SARP family transcriptional activator
MATLATTMSYVVKPGDTLWSIAEHELGSPLKWSEIAQLNYGRTQADGSRLTDAHWIFPGWELMLPVSPITGSTDAVDRITVPQWTPPASRTEDDEQSSPATPGTAGSGAEEKAHDYDASDVGANEPRPPPTDTEKETGGSHPAIPIGGFGYGVLGAGLVLLLERMRRAQRRHRPNGLRIALPDGDLAQLERRMRIEADHDGVEVVDLGLRALVVNSLRTHAVIPQATMVRLTDDALEVVLDPSSAKSLPPEPFTSDSHGTSWTLLRDQRTVQGLRADPDVQRMDAPFPALVTIGQDESGLVLVDLEQAGSLDVAGAEQDKTVGTIALEIATAKWTDQVDLVLVGFDEDFQVLERVSHVATIAELLPRLRRRVRERAALLESVGCHANWEIRWTEGGDSWDLCVVACASSAIAADREGAVSLVGLAASGGKGLAVVLGSDGREARWHLRPVAGRMELEADGAWAAVRQSEAKGPSLMTGVGSLVTLAGQWEGVLPTEPPYDTIADRGRTEVPETGSEEREMTFGVSEEGLEPARLLPSQMACEVEVRLLGPIEIVGAARPFTRAWAIELIVYLAMHRKGASSDQWATALWPDKVMAAASLHSTASAARRSLGVSSTGGDHLPRAHGRLCLAPTVGSDWNLFVELSEQASPESWRRAIELIRGRPFEGLRSPDWVLLEGIAANVEAVVVDLASRYAEYCLTAGDPNDAEWSARQGLRVSAYDERLYRVLLKAADAAGNPAGVESVMAELVHLVADDIEPFDAVHPETLDLYRSLSRRVAPSLKP